MFTLVGIMPDNYFIRDFYSDIPMDTAVADMVAEGAIEVMTYSEWIAE